MGGQSLAPRPTRPPGFHWIARWFVVFVPVAMLLSACSEEACKPTVTTTRAAAAVDLTSVDRSSILSATLRWKKRPLAGKWIEFSIRRKNAVVAGDQEDMGVGGSATGRDGVAQFDLKKLPADRYAQALTAESYAAAFGGDATYCGSSGRASFDKARTPALPVATPTLRAAPPTDAPDVASIASPRRTPAPGDLRDVVERALQVVDQIGRAFDPNR